MMLVNGLFVLSHLTSLLSAKSDDPSFQLARHIYSNEKRAIPIQKLSLHSLAEFTPPPPRNAPQPDGNHFTITSPGAPADDGVDLFMGSDLRIRLNSTFHSDCTRVHQLACYDSMRDVFVQDIGNRIVQRRQAGIFLSTAIIVGIITVILGFLVTYQQQKSFKTPPKHLHIPPRLIQPLEADTAQDASQVFKSKNGNVSIHLQSDLARSIRDLINTQHEDCQPHHTRDLSTLSKRSWTEFIMQCIALSAILLTKHLAGPPGNPLAGLLQVDDPDRALGRPNNADGQRVVAAIEQAAMGALAELARDHLARVVRETYWLMYSQQVNNQPVGVDNTVPQDLIDKSDQALCPAEHLLQCNDQQCRGSGGRCTTKDLKNCQCSDDEGRCPDDETLMPACPNCGGSIGGGKCIGGDGFKAGCDCWEDENPAPYRLDRGSVLWKNDEL